MIEVKGIYKHYGRKKVLEDICLTAKCGESIAIVGRNGCGKTTLMQILAGMIKQEQGEIFYFGKNVKENKKFFRDYCGYVPQENPLMEELSVKDNLRLWGNKNGEVFDRVLKEFQLSELLHTTVDKLSGGMKRRLSIACAVMQWPPILLMDEPTAALDLYYKESIHQWMKKYLQKNGIILIATHDEQEILASDRCLLLDDGRLIELSQGKERLQTIKQYMFVS